MKIITCLTRRSRLTALVVAGLAALVAGSAFAASHTVSTTGTDTVVTVSHNVTLSDTGGTKTPVATLTFPKTSAVTHYVLTGDGDAVNFGPSDYTRCQLMVNGTQVGAVSTIIGSPTASGNEGPAGWITPFSLAGAATVPTSGGTAVLQCWHDTTNGAVPYVDGGATVWAHKTNSLIIGTE